MSTEPQPDTDELDLSQVIAYDVGEQDADGPAEPARDDVTPPDLPEIDDEEAD